MIYRVGRGCNSSGNMWRAFGFSANYIINVIKRVRVYFLQLFDLSGLARGVSALS